MLPCSEEVLTYADAITFGAEKVDKKLVEEFSKVKGKKVLKFNAESDLTDYLQLYTDLAANNFSLISYFKFYFQVFIRTIQNCALNSILILLFF